MQKFSQHNFPYVASLCQVKNQKILVESLPRHAIVKKVTELGVRMAAHLKGSIALTGTLNPANHLATKPNPTCPSDFKLTSCLCPASYFINQIRKLSLPKKDFFCRLKDCGRDEREKRQDGMERYDYLTISDDWYAPVFNSWHAIVNSI